MTRPGARSGMLARIADLFEGPAGLEPWSPPEVPAPMTALLPWRAFDERSEMYVNAGSTGFVIEIPPFAGIDEETLGSLSGTLADECVRVSARHRLISIRPDVRMTVSMSGSDRSPRAEG